LQLLTTTGFVTKFFPQLNRVCHKSGPNFEYNSGISGSKTSAPAGSESRL